MSLPQEICADVFRSFSPATQWDLRLASDLPTQVQDTAAYCLRGQAILYEAPGESIRTIKGDPNSQAPITTVTVISTVPRLHLCACDSCCPDYPRGSKYHSNLRLSEAVTALGPDAKISTMDYHTGPDASYHYVESVQHCKLLSEKFGPDVSLIHRNEDGKLRYFALSDNCTGDSLHTEVGMKDRVYIGQGEAGNDKAKRIAANLLFDSIHNTGQTDCRVTFVDPMSMCPKDPLRARHSEVDWHPHTQGEAEQELKDVVTDAVFFSNMNLEDGQGRKIYGGKRSIEGFVESQTAFTTQTAFDSSVLGKKWAETRKMTESLLESLRA